VDPHESSPGSGGSDRQDLRSGDPIMGNLPRSRPQRGGSVRKQPPPRPRDPHATTPPPVPPPPPEGAPGLPRLALDGAIEAAKLPVKVGANITFRALDAVADVLRRR
jgi:hypothetical protein